MGLAVISGAGAPDIRGAIGRLQLEQFKHDETCHREIARLGTQDRLKHFALHFAKYAGNLVEADGDPGQIQRIVTDVFVIGTSCANTLNLRLPEALAQPGRPVSSGGDIAGFAKVLTVQAGRMAAACEKLDHLEDFAFRPVIRDAAVTLVDEAIGFAEACGWDLETLVQARLATAKEKFIFHGSL